MVSELKLEATAAACCWLCWYSVLTLLQEVSIRRRMPSTLMTSEFCRLVSAMPLRSEPWAADWRTGSRVMRSASRVMPTSSRAPIRAAAPMATWKAKQMPR